MRGYALSLLLDLLCVLAFVVIGRLNHAEGLTLEGVALTLWPFLAGLVGGWVVSLPWKPWRNPASVPTGLLVLLLTVCGGVQLRDAIGEGSPLSFTIVAAVFLGVTLLGWRGVAQLVRRLRTRTGGADSEDAAVEARQEA